MPRRHLAVGAISVGSLAVLLGLGDPVLSPGWDGVVGLLRSDPESLLTGATLDAAWLLALWLTLGTALHAAACLPGAAGRLAAAASSVLTPRLLRRVLDLSLGAGLVVVPGAPVLTAALPVAVVPAAASSTLPPVPPPVLALPRQVPDLDRPSSAPLPVLDRPATPRAALEAGPQHVLVTVHPGDSLWSITSGVLPPATRNDSTVAEQWPRWWQANRQVIGPDPNLIRPGQQLVPPGGGVQ